MKNSFYILAFIVVGLMIFSQCKHVSSDPASGNGNNNPTDTTKTPLPPSHGDTVCFSTQILPMIVNNCATPGCHDATTHLEGYNLTNYANIKSIAGTSTSTSKLITYITTTSSKVMPPPPMARMDTASVNLIKKWMAQGRNNYDCAGWYVCDTANVTYTNQVMPIMNAYCKSCHNTNNKQGNINLDNYADVKTQTQSGKLICSVSGGSNCIKMPQSSYILSKCEVRKIILWNQKGCPQ